MGSLPVPSPIAGRPGLLRRAGSGASCICQRAPIFCSQVLRQPDPVQRAPLPLSRRRRSRYLPVVRRSAAACAARCSAGSAIFSGPVRPWPSSGEIQFFAHLSMLCDRGARSMPSSSAFPIGSRHPDLARPLQSRSFPLTASAATRFDRAKNPFQGLRNGGDFQPSFYYTSHADCDPDAPRYRVPASAAGPGFRSYFQIDPLAAHTGAHFSGPGQALGARDRLARRRYPPLDRAARGTGLISESSMGDWLVAASFALQPGRYRSTAQCVHTVFDQRGSTEYGALDLMTKSRTFPGDFAWRWVRRRLSIRKDVGRHMMGDAGHARQPGGQQAPRKRIAIG